MHYRPRTLVLDACVDFLWLCPVVFCMCVLFLELGNPFLGLLRGKTVKSRARYRGPCKSEEMEVSAKGPHKDS